MSYQITGKLIKIYDENKVSDKFKKREFVIEKQDGNYTDSIKFQLVQDKTNLIDDFSLGNEITIDFNIKGNEWKDSYFVNLQAWRIKTETKTQTTNEAPPPSMDEIPLNDESDDVLPF